jgi:hypothetical protein
VRTRYQPADRAVGDCRAAMPASPAPSPRRAPVVHMMYGTGGGGHLSSARAVRAALAQLPHPPTVVLVDASALAGVRFGDSLYNTLLSAGATPLITLLHAAAAVLLPLVSPAYTARFRRFWSPLPAAISDAEFRCFHDFPDGARPPPPDVVVSFIPQLNAIFGNALASLAALLEIPAPVPIPLVTVLTDFSHTPEHPWLQHDAQHVVCGTRKAFLQAAALLPRARRTQVSGMVVSPSFYPSIQQLVESDSRDALLTRLGLHISPVGAEVRGRETVLLLFGADPPTGAVRHLARCFAERSTDDAVNLVVVCGRNKGLRRHLVSDMRQRTPTVVITDSDSSAALTDTATTPEYPAAMHMHVTGFTSEVPALMRASSVLIGKPGPGVVSESLVARVPLILLIGDNPASVMQQEHDVADWVRDKGVGRVARSSPEAANLVTHEHVTAMRQAIDALPPNNAVFEVARIVAHAVARPRTSSGPPLLDADGETDADLSTAEAVLASATAIGQKPASFYKPVL